MNRTLLGPWLADIAANFLVIVLIVLVVLSQMPRMSDVQAPEITMTPRPIAALPADMAVRALRDTLRSTPQGTVISLTPETPQIPQKLNDPIVLLVLSPQHHAQVADRLSLAGRTWTELTVPHALKTAQDTWAPEFLALSTRAERGNLTRFSEDLRELLLRRGARASSSGTDTLTPTSDTAPPPSLTQRVLHWLSVARDLTAFLIIAAVILILRRLSRWAIKA